MTNSIFTIRRSNQTTQRAYGRLLSPCRPYRTQSRPMGRQHLPHYNWFTVVDHVIDAPEEQRRLYRKHRDSRTFQRVRKRSAFTSLFLGIDAELSLTCSCGQLSTVWLMHSLYLQWLCSIQLRFFFDDRNSFINLFITSDISHFQRKLMRFLDFHFYRL